MKKIIVTFVAIMLILSIAVPTYAAETGFERNISLGEIRSTVEEYFAENNVNMNLETKDFYDYVVEEILGEGDDNLKQLGNYRLVIEFMAEYKNVFEDYLMCEDILSQSDDKSLVSEILASNDCIIFDEDSNSVKFVFSDRFNSMTIGDIIKRNKKMIAEFESIQSINAMPLAIASYSPSSAASYAEQYATMRNVFYPGYVSDCTNFVSQCLHAGGLPMVGTNSTTGIYESSSKWYCICTEASTSNPDKGWRYAVTTSWIRTTDFNTFLTPKAKAKVKKTSVSALNASCAVGDVVQLLSETGTPTHTVIISKKANGTAYYCGHSNNVKNGEISRLFSNTDTVLLFDLT